MPDRLVFDPTTVFDFVSAQMPLNAVAGMTGIGLERDGVLVAGVVYEGFNGSNLWMHVAALPGRHWVTRRYLAACFGYPFVQCGVQRVSGYVEAANLAAVHFDERLGFQREAVLHGAGRAGGDVIIYRMKREECRYV